MAVLSAGTVWRMASIRSSGGLNETRNKRYLGNNFHV